MTGLSGAARSSSSTPLRRRGRLGVRRERASFERGLGSLAQNRGASPAAPTLACRRDRQIVEMPLTMFPIAGKRAAVDG